MLFQCIKCTMSDLHTCLWYTPIHQCWKSLILYIYLNLKYKKVFFPMCFWSPTGICLSMYWHLLISTTETGKHKIINQYFWFLPNFIPYLYTLGQPRHFLMFLEKTLNRELICDLLNNWSTITTWHRNRSYDTWLMLSNNAWYCTEWNRVTIN